MIHFVVGTRAQLLKLAPVMKECERRGLAWRWIYTAQHRDTIDQLLETFELPPPDVVMVRWKTEAKSMGRMGVWFVQMVRRLPRSRKLLGARTGAGNIVLTHGDTFTTWFGCLIGKLTRTEVMHVESGLRSFNLRRPFPEELNRLIAFRLSDVYACPGEWAVANLARYRGPKINTLANTQVDTLRIGLAREPSTMTEVPDAPYVVVTLHRYENIFDEGRLRQIAERVEEIARRFTVVLICHPATELQLQKYRLFERLERNPAISLSPRLSYLPFIHLVRGAEFVVSDGGGNQEELAYLGKPTLIFRQETEREEGLGETAVLSDASAASVLAFLDGYMQRARPIALPDVSPSEIIGDYLESEGFGRA